MLFVHPGTGPILEATYDIVIPQASITVSGKYLRIEFEYSLTNSQMFIMI